MSNSKYVIVKITVEDDQELSLEKMKELFEQLSDESEQNVKIKPIEIYSSFPLCY